MNNRTSRLLKIPGDRGLSRALRRAWTAAPWFRRAKMREDAERLQASLRDGMRRLP